MSNRPITRVLDALHHVTGAQPQHNGRGWSSRCPAHDDRRPSLSIAEGRDGCVLLTCHAGCTLDAICGALDLNTVELFPDGGDGYERWFAAASRSRRTLGRAKDGSR